MGRGVIVEQEIPLGEIRQFGATAVFDGKLHQRAPIQGLRPQQGKVSPGTILRKRGTHLGRNQNGILCGKVTIREG